MRQDQALGYALKKGEGVQIDFRGTKMTMKVSGAQSEEAYSLIEMTHPANAGPAQHIHPTGSEAFYVLEGEYTIHCDQSVYVAQAGDFVLIPKGIPHSYCSGEEGGKVLVISPAGLEKYFVGVAEVLKANASITWELEQEIARRYGQEFLNELNHWGQ
jgi:quercetin dioxygenase-like cupin family protein